MRKIILALILLSYLISFSYAAPCYGTRMPKQNKLFLGLQNHTLSNRYLINDFGKVSSIQNFLLLSYGVFDWLSIDLKGGVGNIKQHPVASEKIDYPSYLGGGYGFRLKLLDRKKIKSVFGFQHISIHPKTVDLAWVKNKAVLDDWQFSLIASYDFSRITPYIGTKWSRLDYIHWVGNNRKRVKPDLTKNVGMILGFDLSITKNIWVNLEGQIFDGEAASVSLNYSF